MMGEIIFGIGVFFLFIWCIDYIVKIKSGKLDGENITDKKKKMVRMLNIKDKIVNVSFEKGRFSKVKVVKENKEYSIILTKSGKYESVLLHELVHIKRGQADKLHKIKNQIIGKMYNFYADLFFAWPAEIKYSFRKNLLPKPSKIQSLS